jgi:hypothetical protein
MRNEQLTSFAIVKTELCLKGIRREGFRENEVAEQKSHAHYSKSCTNL